MAEGGDAVADTKIDDDAPAPRSERSESDVWWLGRAIASITRFFREIVAELRKVIWPSRQELITYTLVVVIFVVIMVSIVAGLDIGFAKLVVAVFG
jgi:preprotein translocase subunit SecE